jgi:hypothetical protein
MFGSNSARAVCLAAVAAFVALMPVRAAAVAIKASFAPIRMTARAGEVLTTAYDLKLQEGEPTAHFKVEVQDWWRSEDGQQSFYAPAGAIGRSCGRWVTANPQESTVAGGETLKVRLTISVPENVTAGGYWCALSVDEMPDPLSATPDGVGVRFLASVSTGIYVNVNPIERGVDILSVEVDGDRALARIENTGNTPVTVEGRFEFAKPGADRPTAVVELARNVLLTEPITTGLYAAALPAATDLPPGRYIVRLILDIGLDHYIGVQKELEIVRAAAREPDAPR